MRLTIALSSPAPHLQTMKLLLRLVELADDKEEQMEEEVCKHMAHDQRPPRYARSIPYFSILVDKDWWNDMHRRACWASWAARFLRKLPYEQQQQIDTTAWRIKLKRRARHAAN